MTLPEEEKKSLFQQILGPDNTPHLSAPHSFRWAPSQVHSLGLLFPPGACDQSHQLKAIETLPDSASTEAPARTVPV